MSVPQYAAEDITWDEPVADDGITWDDAPTYDDQVSRKAASAQHAVERMAPYADNADQVSRATSYQADTGILTDVTDTARNLAIGFNSVAEQARELTSRIPLVGKSFVEAMDTVDRYLSDRDSETLMRQYREQQEQKRSLEGQAAMEKKWATFDDPAWADPRAWLGGLAQAAPGTALTMVPSMALAKLAFATKVAAGASIEAATAAAGRVAYFVGGVGEGLLGGAGASLEVRKMVEEMTPEKLASSEAYTALVKSGMTPEAARTSLAEDAATKAFLIVGTTTGLLGGAGDKAMAKIATKDVKEATYKRIIKGIISEGWFEEAPQGATEAMGKNIALMPAKPDQTLMEGAGEGVVSGGALGGFMGGTIAAGTGRGKPAAAPAPAPGLVNAAAPGVDPIIQTQPDSIDGGATRALPPPGQVAMPMGEALPVTEIPNVTPGEAHAGAVYAARDAEAARQESLAPAPATAPSGATASQIQLDPSDPMASIAAAAAAPVTRIAEGTPIPTSVDPNTHSAAVGDLGGTMLEIQNLKLQLKTAAPAEKKAINAEIERKTVQVRTSLQLYKAKHGSEASDSLHRQASETFLTLKGDYSALQRPTAVAESTPKQAVTEIKPASVGPAVQDSAASTGREQPAKTEQIISGPRVVTVKDIPQHAVAKLERIFARDKSLTRAEARDEIFDMEQNGLPRGANIIVERPDGGYAVVGEHDVFPDANEEIQAEDEDLEPSNVGAATAAPPAITSPVDEAAHEAAASTLNERTPPTPAQAGAGNYKMGEPVVFANGALRFRTENPSGSLRTDKNIPPQWSSRMAGFHYGYDMGTKAADATEDKNQEIDWLVAEGTDPSWDGDVFVMDAIVQKTGKFDEHKWMAGVGTLEEAKAGFAAQYPKGWKLGQISKTTMRGYSTWKLTRNTQTPYAPQPHTKGSESSDSTWNGGSMTVTPVMPNLVWKNVPRKTKGAALSVLRKHGVEDQLLTDFPEKLKADRGASDLTQPEVNVVSAAMADALDKHGLPPVLLSMTQGMHVTPSGGDAVTSIYRDGTGSIGFRRNVLAAVIGGHAGWTNAIVPILIHETWHVGDTQLRPGKKAVAATHDSPRFAITNDKPSGDIIREAQLAYLTGPTELKSLLKYPFSGFLDTVGNQALQDEFKEEVGAQLWALYHVRPDLMKAHHPIAFTLYEEIHAQLSEVDRTQPKSKQAEAAREIFVANLGVLGVSGDAVGRVGVAPQNQRGLLQRSSRESGVADATTAQDTAAGTASGQAEEGNITTERAAGGQNATGAASSRARKARQRAARQARVGARAAGSSAALGYRQNNSKPLGTKSVEVDDVGRHFNELIADEFGGPLDYNNPAHVERAVALMRQEFAYQLTQARTGLDWYSEDIKGAFEMTAGVIPELNNELHRQLFGVTTALMSPGTKAHDNWKYGAIAYKVFVETGRIPETKPQEYGGELWGVYGATTAKAVAQVNSMIEEMGRGPATEWLLSHHTVQAINKMKHKYGHYKDAPVGGKMLDLQLGVYMFGEKVGPFALNVLGIDTEVTVDVWLTRTFNRHFGTMFHDTGAKAGTMRESPSEPERRVIKTMIEAVAKAEGYSNSQVQAVLWFFEQQVYTQLGAASPSMTFSDGARDFLADQNGETRGSEDSVGSERVAEDAAEFGAEAVAKEATLGDFTKGKIKGLLSKDGWAVLTAENPNNKAAKPVDNKRANRRLEADLRGMGLHEYQKVVGRYGAGDENSFVVTGITHEQAEALRDKYGQESYLDRRGLVYGDHTIAPAKSISEKPDSASDFYTVMPSGLKWEIDIDFAGRAVADADLIERTGDGKGSLKTNESREAQTKTPAFKKWFGDSKVVDADGKPLVVYHGTASDIESFSPQSVGSRHVDLEVGEVYYFSSDKATANWYAQSSGKQARGGANVMPVYLSMQNPLVVDFQGTGIETLADDIARAKKDGRDGLVATNYDDGSVSDHYIAFLPEQIKSATGNSGAFSKGSPKVNESREAQTKTPAFKKWFGDSKVVDKNGNPLVVYHGTFNNFDEFNANYSDLGSHFGSSAQAHSRVSTNHPSGELVMPVYLSLQNPLRLRDTGGFSGGDIAEQLLDLGIVTKRDLAQTKHVDGYPADDAVRLLLERAGYDGVVYLNRREGIGNVYALVDDVVASNKMSDEEFLLNAPTATDSYIAFRPEQIKSATGNSGAFSKGSPKINESREEDRENVVESTELKGDGRGFTEFFTEASRGNRAPDKAVPYTPVLDISEVSDFSDEYVKHRGNFDDHIATSIPGFREVQQAVGDAIVKTYTGHPTKSSATLLDIAASEGAFNKAITEMSDGLIFTLALDPNLQMAKFFEEHSQVAGAEYDVAAFGSKEDEGKLAWTEDDGTKIRFFKPIEKYDVVHESMGFQFISNTRNAQFARVKELMQPDGIALFEEKIKEDTPQWRANEKQKDAYKARYFTAEQMKAKAAEVLEKGEKAAAEAESQREQAVVGMNDLMTTGHEFETALTNNWKHVAQYWDAGNFKGYVASDSKVALDRFLENLPNLNSEYSTVSTPAAVSGGQLKSNASTEVPEPLWYSALGEALPSAPWSKAGDMPAKQLNAWLTSRSKDGKIKAEELKWSGVTDWLDLAGGARVSLADAQSFLDQNGVRVSETELVDGKGTDYSFNLMAMNNQMDDLESALSEERDDDRRDNLQDKINALQQEIDAFISSEQPGEGTKFSSYQLPGGKNYRELLLTLPAQKSGMSDAMKSAYENLKADRAATTDQARIDALNSAMRELQRQGSLDSVQKNFRSPHFDTPNILAHVRFNERTDADGKKVLFLEELQSDWAQKGRQEGFSGGKQVVDAVRAGRGWQPVNQAGLVLDDGIYQTREDAIEAGGAAPILAGLPSAPFVGKTEAWVALALKRMIRYAADNGFDRIAWTTGDQQAERYDLSKQVKSVEIERFRGDDPPTFNVTMTDLTGSEHDLGNIKADKMQDAVGKELTDKAMQQKPGISRYTGNDLKVGGEGMKSFYDKIVPQVASDVLKKLGGGKVSAVDIRFGESHAKVRVLARGARVEIRDAGGVIVEDIDFPSSAKAADYAENYNGNPPSNYAQQPGFDLPPKAGGPKSTFAFGSDGPAIHYGPLTPAQKRALKNTGGIVDRKTMRQYIDEVRAAAFKNAKQGIVDQFAPLKALDPHAYLLARMSKASDGALEAAMMYGNLKLINGVVDTDASGTGFIEHLQSLEGEHHRFFRWVAGQRADRLSKEAREHLFTPADIAAYKTLIEGNLPSGQPRRPAFMRALAAYNATSKSIMDLAEKSNIIDGASRALWENEFYVPFYRAIEAGVTGPNIGSSGQLARQYAFKKLKGGSEKLNEDLLANVLMNWSHLLTASGRNRAARASLIAAELKGVAREEPGWAVAGAAIPKDAIWYLENGKKTYYSVSDPAVLASLVSLEAGIVGGYAGEVLGKFKNALTIGVTASPTFKVRNLTRDSVHSVAVADLSYNVAGNVASGIRAMANKKGQTYASLLASGGIIRFGTMLDGNRASHVEKLVRRGVKANTVINTREKAAAMVSAGWDWYNEMGDISEGANRAALYMQLRKKGIGHAEAAFAARDLMDFSKGGSWPIVRFLTQTVPFLNARIQGLARLGEGAAADPARFAGVLGMTALASIALMLYYRDDDDWKQREDWDRDNYWWFKIDDVAMRLPKPFEVGVIATLAERSVELWVEDEMTQKKFLERVGFAISQTLAMNPVPQMAKPMIDLYANKDSFTGRDIETQGMDRLPTSDRIGGKTTEVAKLLGQAGVLSPVQIDHLVKGYFGWLGTMSMTAASWGVAPFVDGGEKPAMEMRDVFLAGNFIETLPAPQSKYVTQFYDQAKEINETYAAHREKLKYGDREGAAEIAAESPFAMKKNSAVNSYRNKLGDISTEMKKIERDMAMDSDTKRTKINLLLAKRNALAKRAAQETAEPQ